MKIAVIAASRVPSTAANSIQVLKVAQAFARLGHTTTLYVPGAARRASSLEADLAAHYGLTTAFTICWLPAQSAFHRYDFAWSAVQAARRAGAQAVYTWMLQAAVLARILRVPSLLELHDRITGRAAPWLFRRYMAAGSPRVPRRILPITAALRRVLEAQFQTTFPPDEVVISPDGVDLERYAGLPTAPAARAVLGWPEAPTAVYTGHFYAGRGMDLLSGLAQACPQVQFAWVGGRPEDVHTWSARLRQAGISNVRLTGFVENARLPLYQAGADVLLMPYERSVATSSGGDTADICSPMKMFEYMAAGRAILTSDLPVLREVLRAETGTADEAAPGNAVFCAAGDLPAWSTTLTGLLENPARREMLGRQASQDVRAYTWQERALRALQGFG